MNDEAKLSEDYERKEGLLRVLSLGAGVQSTAVAMMSLTGDLPPLDAAIFADTGNEPASVYRHLEWLTAELVAGGVKLHTVTAGNLGADTERAWRGETEFVTNSNPPFYTTNAQGKPVVIRRKCTLDYKVDPILRKTKELIGLPNRGRLPREHLVTMVMGISWDEWQRMREPRWPFIVHEYPLVDRRIDRAGCLRWMREHGYPEPPRSACVFCPFHRDAEWRRLRDSEPDEWAEAVRFDAAIRDGTGQGLPRPLFLHRSLRPLAEVDLSTPEDHGQANLFDNECEGMCGV